MAQLIVIGGAPGSGKTTLTKRLHQEYQSVMLDFGWLRELHLDPEWRKASPAEEAMAFENLIFIVRNYLKHGYSHILLNDLEDFRIQHIPNLFEPPQYLIVTLTLSDEIEHKRRVLDLDRDSGFRDYQRAIAWNRALLTRPLLPNEYRLDNTHLTPDEVSRQIMQLVAEHRHKRELNTPRTMSVAPLLRKVDCVRLFVPNLDAGLAFYCDRLGQALVWRTKVAAGLRMPDCEAEIVLQTEDQRPETDILVESADKAAQRFVEVGGKILVAPFDIQIGRCVVVEDPFGNVLVLLDASKGLLITDAVGNILGNKPPS